MDQKQDYRFDTRVIHAAQSPEDWQGATLPPIFQTASHLHPTAENLSQTFAGKKADHHQASGKGATYFSSSCHSASEGCRCTNDIRTSNAKSLNQRSGGGLAASQGLFLVFVSQSSCPLNDFLVLFVLLALPFSLERLALDPMPK